MYVPVAELQQTKSPLEQVSPQNMLMALAEMRSQGAFGNPNPTKNNARTQRSRPRVEKTG